MNSDVARYSSFLIAHSSLAVDSFASLGMTNKMQNKTAKLHALICQHDLITTEITQNLMECKKENFSNLHLKVRFHFLSEVRILEIRFVKS